MKRDPRETERYLVAIASEQGGYFTAQQALSVSYTYRQQHFHRERGNWLLIDRGLFRLRDYPSSPNEDLIRWGFWSLSIPLKEGDLGNFDVIQMEIKNMPHGIYFLKINTHTNWLFRKFVNFGFDKNSFFNIGIN